MDPENDWAVSTLRWFTQYVHIIFCLNNFSFSFSRRVFKSGANNDGSSTGKRLVKEMAQARLLNKRAAQIVANREAARENREARENRHPHNPPEDDHARLPNPGSSNCQNAGRAPAPSQRSPNPSEDEQANDEESTNYPRKKSSRKGTVSARARGSGRKIISSRVA
jgi:hypothetical protein